MCAFSIANGTMSLLNFERNSSTNISVILISVTFVGLAISSLYFNNELIIFYGIYGVLSLILLYGIYSEALGKDFVTGIITFFTVNQEDLTIQQGTLLVNEVYENFNNLMSSFNQVDENVKEENIMIRNITEIFSEIKEKIDSIASISEGHAVSAQEIINTIESNNNQIDSISDSMETILKTSTNLEKVVNS